MGSCLTRENHRDDENAQTDPAVRTSTKKRGENQISEELPRWTSEPAMTSGALISKRDEFWETAPSYEGKKEVWEALRSAAEALERGDVEQAQLMIDSANIKLPNGKLSESYDDLGTKYCIPAYCISAPDNLITEKGASASSRGSKTKRASSKSAAKMDTVLRLRLSTENEKTFEFPVSSKELVQTAKMRLQSERSDISKSQQRWFCQGRVLVDNQTITQARVPEGFVIQVILIPKL